jgi:chemotaxis protein MotA
LNIGSILGFIGGTAMIVISIYSSGGRVSTYWDLASVACTIGGSFFALMLQYGVKDTLSVGGIFKRCFSTYTYDCGKIIDSFVGYSEKARREGLLSLEDDIQSINDPFIRESLHLVIDGTDADAIRAIMEGQVDQMNARHEQKMKMLDAWAKLAPGFGMLGTVLGLIAMMAQLEDKSRIGPNMAVALITTFYGAIMANFLFTPMMGKLAKDDESETNMKNMVIEGVMSIQAGDNPRVLLVKLTSFLPPSEKEGFMKKYAAA